MPYKASWRADAVFGGAYGVTAASGTSNKCVRKIASQFSVGKMCGIRAALFCSECALAGLPDEPPVGVVDLLRARGPQSFGRSVLSSRDTTCVVSAAVLHLRGTRACAQPVLSGDVLLAWNGEVFGGAITPAVGESDTEAVMDAVCAALSPSRGDPHAALTACLAGIRGPFAVCISVSGDGLYFARDRIGRRSLLVEPPSACGHPFLVSSVGLGDCSELPPRGVYRLAIERTRGPGGLAVPPATAQLLWSLPSCRPSFSWSLTCLPWPPSPTSLHSPLFVPPWLPAAESAAPAADWVSEADVAAAALELLRRLGEAVRVRVKDLPVEPRARCVGCVLPRPMLAHDSCVSVALQTAALGARKSVDSCGDWLPASSSSCERVHTDASGRLGCSCVARLAVPFSGGLDSMILARLAHEYLPISEAIDLVNVCFAVDHRSPDRVAALKGVQELRRCCPGRHFSLICVDESYNAVLAASLRISALLHPRTTHLDFNVGAAFWFVSRGVGFAESDDVTGAGSGGECALSAADRRLLRYGTAAAGRREAGDFHLSDFDKGAAATGGPCAALDAVASLAAPSDVAFALHGWRMPPLGVGADAAPPSTDGSTLPADLRARVRAYEARIAPFHCAAPGVNPDALESATDAEGSGDGEGGDAPASRTASGDLRPGRTSAGCEGIGPTGSGCASPAHHSCALHMCRVCCVSATTSVPAKCPVHRVPKSTEPSSTRPPRIQLGTHKCDDAVSPSSRVLVRTAARVFLSGLGADEQLAGYGRHRTAFRHGGWFGLQRELSIDSGRLWIRNLGRGAGWGVWGHRSFPLYLRFPPAFVPADDRVWSDHAREVRTPFLDEGVVELLRALPLPLLCDLRLPPGVGDKRLLRVAGRMLGLGRSATLVKRAIHFGSRIAKQSNVSCFGSNRAARGDVAYAPWPASGGFPPSAPPAETPSVSDAPA